jgi:hypothetical protein
MAQVVVDDPGRRRKRVADRADADPDRRSFDDPIGETALLVEVQAVDADVAGDLRVEAADARRVVHPDRLQAERQPERIVRGGDGIVGCVLGVRGPARHAKRGESPSDANESGGHVCWSSFQGAAG